MRTNDVLVSVIFFHSFVFIHLNLYGGAKEKLHIIAKLSKNEGKTDENKEE